MCSYDAYNMGGLVVRMLDLGGGKLSLQWPEFLWSWPLAIARPGIKRVGWNNGSDHLWKTSKDWKQQRKLLHKWIVVKYFSMAGSWGIICHGTEE